MVDWKESDFYVVFTMILYGSNSLVCQVAMLFYLKPKQPQIADPLTFFKLYAKDS